MRKKLIQGKPGYQYQYITFLRGINVGGNNPIGMTDLKIAFERMGFFNVRTVLASGNVVFASEQDDKDALRKEIESSLKTVLKKEIMVILKKPG